MFRAPKLILASLLVGQAVLAQPAPTAPPAAPPTGVQPGVPPASDVDLSVRQRSTLSPQDMVNQGREYRDRMDKIAKQIAALIEQAKKQKDVIRLNCLADKLAQLKANIAVADNALQTLQEAIARRDEGGSVHEYTRLTIVHQKAQVIGAEAQACVGEDLAYVGATRVDVEVEGVPDVPTGPSAPDHIVDRPPLASPTT